MLLCSGVCRRSESEDIHAPRVGVAQAVRPDSSNQNKGMVGMVLLRVLAANMIWCIDF